MNDQRQSDSQCGKFNPSPLVPRATQGLSHQHQLKVLTAQGELFHLQASEPPGHVALP